MDLRKFTCQTLQITETQGLKYRSIPIFILNANIANTTQYDRDDTDITDMMIQNKWPILPTMIPTTFIDTDTEISNHAGYLKPMSHVQVIWIYFMIANVSYLNKFSLYCQVYLTITATFSETEGNLGFVS